MSKYKDDFISTLETEGLKYRELDDRVVEIRFGGDNLSTIRILVFFSKDGAGYAQLAGMEICSFKDNELAAGLITCNEMNQKYRWVKFYLDKDQDLTVSADAILDINSAGKECLELVLRLVHIIDESYVDFMRAKLLGN